MYLNVSLLSPPAFKSSCTSLPCLTLPPLLSPPLPDDPQDGMASGLDAAPAAESARECAGAAAGGGPPPPADPGVGESAPPLHPHPPDGSDAADHRRLVLRTPAITDGRGTGAAWPTLPPPPATEGGLLLPAPVQVGGGSG